MRQQFDLRLARIAKPRIAKPRTTIYRPTFGAPAGQPLPCAGIPALPSTLLTMPRPLPSSTELSPAPQHLASRQAPPFPRCLRAEPKINGCLSDARLDKPRFAIKAQVLQEALPPPPPWLAHLCSLTHTLPPLSRYLYSLCQSGYLQFRRLLFFSARG